MGDVLKIRDEYRQVQWAAAIQECKVSGLTNLFNKCLWLYKQKIKSHHSSARSAINLTSLTARAS